VPPKPPPVYCPTKSNALQGKMLAPPVYMPNTVQQKPAMHTAPPVYKPNNALPIQPKMGPPVYRPQTLQLKPSRPAAPSVYMPNIALPVSTRRGARVNDPQQVQLKLNRPGVPTIYKLRNSALMQSDISSNQNAFGHLARVNLQSNRVSSASAFQPLTKSTNMNSGSLFAANTVQRMRQTGKYTTSEEGNDARFYEQAEQELGQAIAHGSGNSEDGKSSKFLNQEKKLQARKKELKEKEYKDSRPKPKIHEQQAMSAYEKALNKMILISKDVSEDIEFIDVFYRYWESGKGDLQENENEKISAIITAISMGEITHDEIIKMSIDELDELGQKGV